MGYFEGVESVEAVATKKSSVVLCKRKLHFLSVLLVAFISLSCLGITAGSSSLSKQVKYITSYWSPNLTDLGKLKYVSDEEVSAMVEDFALPFVTSYVSELETGEFEINGLGGLVVKACLGGSVESVTSEEGKKTVVISHGRSLKTVYSNIDSVGVRVGDKVEKNSPLGISDTSTITLKVLYKNKLLAGLKVVDGQFTFL